MKRKYLTIIAIAIIAVASNLALPYNLADACNTWDPDYNWMTGECDLPNPPSGEREEQGRRCYFPSAPPWAQGEVYAIDCVFQVPPGDCEEQDCPYL